MIIKYDIIYKEEKSEFITFYNIYILNYFKYYFIIAIIINIYIL